MGLQQFQLSGLRTRDIPGQNTGIPALQNKQIYRLFSLNIQEKILDISKKKIAQTY
jgi:hypothetical protein